MTTATIITQAQLAYEAKQALGTKAIQEAPEGATALIIAQRDIDDTDTQTDYWGHKVAEEVVIGYRFTKRESFAALRKVAATFLKTAHLKPGTSKDFEHRENWSMGGGNFLKDGERHANGWKVFSWPIEYGNLTIDRIEIA